jgi:prepilin-type N-terminal cleavage/methylation domain-containing protein
MITRFQSLVHLGESRALRPGFTLSELMVTMAVLGLVAAITTPVILNGVEFHNKKVRFKEVYTSLLKVVRKGAESGDMAFAGDMTYLSKNLNAAKVCSNANAEGCWPGSTDGGQTIDNSEPGILMTSGAMIFGFENTGTPQADAVWVDINGTMKPNKQCKDQLPFIISVADTWVEAGKTVKEGNVIYATIQPGLNTVCSAASFPSN